MRLQELGADPPGLLMSWPLLPDLVCLWASCLGLGYPLTTPLMLGLLSSQGNTQLNILLLEQRRGERRTGVDARAWK